MRMFRIVPLAMILMLPFSASALDMDEKLTMRILSVSASKKTVLVNRGLEDGLVVGDHAKFFLTTGVIARGVVVKASPSRSIWSLYRLVVPEDVMADKVVSIKIASPLKLTEDPTKMLSEGHSEMEAGSEVLTVPAERGDVSPERLARDAREAQEPNELDELENVRSKGVDRKAVDAQADGPVLAGDAKSGTVSTWTLEVWSLLHFNALSTSVDSGDTGTFSGKQSFVDFSLGLEKYFVQRQSWLHKVSLLALIHNSSQELTSAGSEDTVRESSLEYGVGANYHFMEDPFTYGKPILFCGLNFGLGNATSTAEVGTGDPDTFKGSATFFSLGVGGKFYTRWGLGARLVLDYYSRSEKYTLDDGGEIGRTVRGPRLMAGIAYRW